MAKIQKRGLVVSSNDLLEAKYDFSLWQKRVFIYMVSRIGKEDKDFSMQRIYISELLRFFGNRGGKDYDVIRKIPREMFEKEVRVPYLSDAGYKRWYVKRIITEFSEPDDIAEENNYIEMRFHSDLKPYLLDLSTRFSKYDMRNVLELGSVYSFRMFEIIKSRHEIQKAYQPNLEYSIIEFDLEELKAILSVEDKYKLYADFKRFVLDRAQRDLADYCDVAYTLKEIKQGKKVATLQFFARENVPIWKTSNTTPLSLNAGPTLFSDNSPTTPLPTLFLKLEDPVVRSWNVPASTFQTLLAQYSEQQIRQAVDITTESIKTGRIKSSPAGFFIKALEEGWKSAKQAKQTRSQEEGALKQAQVKILQDQLEQLETERRAAANDVIRELTKADAFLAGEAVNKIKANKPLCQSLEQQTGLKLDDDLPMDSWRENKPLRNAVIRQIEAMRPEEFKTVKAQYDSLMAKMRQQIEEMQKG